MPSIAKKANKQDKTRQKQQSQKNLFLTLLNTKAKIPVHSRDQGKQQCHVMGRAHKRASWTDRVLSLLNETSANTTTTTTIKSDNQRSIIYRSGNRYANHTRTTFDISLFCLLWSFIDLNEPVIFWHSSLYLLSLAHSLSGLQAIRSTLSTANKRSILLTCLVKS